MRIAVTNWSRRKVAGAEAYLKALIPVLGKAGHEVAYFCEVDVPANRERLAFPESVAVWCGSELGADRVLGELRAWRPDLIWGHGLLDPQVESETLAVAPGVFQVHGYYGTCISGGKTFKWPVVRPCSRRFGWQCLLHYYPHRCGGWSPFAMVKEYSRQSRRLKVLRQYRAIITVSDHMRAEYVKHGFSPEQVYQVPYCVPERGPVDVRSAAEEGSRRAWRLLFLGRMEFLKGGTVILDALPLVAAQLDRSIHLTFAGDGPSQEGWKRRAGRLCARHPELTVEFVGWMGASERDVLLSRADLVVLPSLWPEPFGLVGPEAGLHGVPVVAFDVGGVRSWLIDGVNGYLAPGDPPTASGLAAAIVECLRDSATYARLRHGALEPSQRLSTESHARHLLDIFERVAGAAGS